MKHPAALVVHLRPSRLIGRWLAAAHCATLVPIWYVPIPHWVSAALTLAVAAHAGWSIRRFGQLHSPGSVVGITLENGVSCTLTARDATAFSGVVAPSTVVLGSLVVLGVQGSGGRSRRALIVPDMLPEGEFRRLRISLKWGGTQESEGSQV